MTILLRGWFCASAISSRSPAGHSPSTKASSRAKGASGGAGGARGHEGAPRPLLDELKQSVEAGDTFPGYLVDSGRSILHACRIIDARVGPLGTSIGPPTLDLAPAYYHSGRYPAWFCLSAIEVAQFRPDAWTLVAFPSRPGDQLGEDASALGQPVRDLRALSRTDATMWMVTEKDSGATA